MKSEITVPALRQGQKKSRQFKAALSLIQQDDELKVNCPPEYRERLICLTARYRLKLKCPFIASEKGIGFFIIRHATWEEVKTAKAKSRKQRYRPQALNPEQRRIILEDPNVHWDWKTMLVLTDEVGMEPRTAQKIAWSDLDTVNCRVNFRSRNSDVIISYPISESLMTYLDKLKASQGAESDGFVCTWLANLSSVAVSNRWHALLKKKGLSDRHGLNTFNWRWKDRNPGHHEEARAAAHLQAFEQRWLQQCEINLLDKILAARKAKAARNNKLSNYAFGRMV